MIRLYDKYELSFAKVTKDPYTDKMRAQYEYAKDHIETQAGFGHSEETGDYLSPPQPK